MIFSLLLTAISIFLIPFTTVQAQNPFLYNPGDLTNITAGSSFMIKWAPSTGTADTVTVLLRQGDPKQLTTVLTIAASIPNTGSLLWPVPSSLVNANLYTFEIYDDLNHDLANYSNQFAIVSTNTVSSVVAGPITTKTGVDGHVTTIYSTATAPTSASTTAASGTETTSPSASVTKNAGKGRRGVEAGIVGLGMIAAMVVL